MRKLHEKPKSDTEYRGVSWDARRGMWRCQIMVGGEYHCLGWHDDPKVAAAYYDKCKMEAVGSLKSRAKTNAELGRIDPLSPGTLKMLELGLGGVGGVSPRPKKA